MDQDQIRTTPIAIKVLVSMQPSLGYPSSTKHVFEKYLLAATCVGRLGASLSRVDSADPIDSTCSKTQLPFVLLLLAPTTNAVVGFCGPAVVLVAQQVLIVGTGLKQSLSWTPFETTTYCSHCFNLLLWDAVLLKSLSHTVRKKDIIW